MQLCNKNTCTKLLYKRNKLKRFISASIKVYICWFQDAAIDWARDHRVHHKYSETDADPHNAKRGFFFSHIGWLLCRKHPEVKEKGKNIDLSDLESDPILAFQKKYVCRLTEAISCCRTNIYNELLFVSDIMSH